MPLETWAKLGMTATEVTDDVNYLMSVYIVLDRAWRKPFSIKSNFARRGAWHVALAASEGLISTCIAEHDWGSRWGITELGIESKGAIGDILQEILNKANGRYDTIN